MVSSSSIFKVPVLPLCVSLFIFLPNCHCYCLGDLRKRDIAGIWRLKSKHSYLPSLVVVKEEENANSARPMKEFTVYPPPKVVPNKMRSTQQRQQQRTEMDDKDLGNDILLLLREDGNFVRYESLEEKKKSSPMHGTIQPLDIMKGCWGLVDGRLILAADRPDDTTNIRSDAKRHDTILCGKIKAQSSNYQKIGDKSSSDEKQEDVHLTVEGEISIGKFFYPQSHPSFFEQPMVGATPTGSFELRQILGNLNAKAESNYENELVEKFRKQDLMNKRYFLTSYPLPTRRQKRKRWSIKYNQYVDEKPASQSEKDLEEVEKNSPMQIKAFEIELYANNTFSSITGLGDTILRGKWSIVGDERDQLWMSVWRFGFGRNVSGSTYSEGLHLNHQDDVSYWGKIYEVDAAEEENCIDDDPIEWKGTRIEVNGAVMLGIGLEPCSVARFTMIEKTELDDDEGYDDEDLDDLPLNIGSFE